MWERLSLIKGLFSTALITQLISVFIVFIGLSANLRHCPFKIMILFPSSKIIERLKDFEPQEMLKDKNSGPAVNYKLNNGGIIGIRESRLILSLLTPALYKSAAYFSKSEPFVVSITSEIFSISSRCYISTCNGTAFTNALSA